MRWFEYSYTCQCGEAEAGFTPSADRFNLRCYLCHRFQQPLLLNLHEDDIDLDDYLEEMFEEDEDWDEDEEFV